MPRPAAGPAGFHVGAPLRPYESVAGAHPPAPSPEKGCSRPGRGPRDRGAPARGVDVKPPLRDPGTGLPGPWRAPEGPPGRSPGPSGVPGGPKGPNPGSGARGGPAASPARGFKTPPRGRVRESRKRPDLAKKAKNGQKTRKMAILAIFRVLGVFWAPGAWPGPPAGGVLHQPLAPGPRGSPGSRDGVPWRHAAQARGRARRASGALPGTRRSRGNPGDRPAARVVNPVRELLEDDLAINKNIKRLKPYTSYRSLPLNAQTCGRTRGLPRRSPPPPLRISGGGSSPGPFS